MSTGVDDLLVPSTTNPLKPTLSSMKFRTAVLIASSSSTARDRRAVSIAREAAGAVAAVSSAMADSTMVASMSDRPESVRRRISMTPPGR